MHLDATPPFFYCFAFFLKTAEKSVKWLTRNINTHHIPLPTIWNHSSVPIIKGESVLCTDVEEATNTQGPCGEGMEQTVNLFWYDATDRKHSSHWGVGNKTSNGELLHHHHDGTFYSWICSRRSGPLELTPHPPLCDIYSCFNICY